MILIGLTGSIAVGKSFVAGVLAGLGCHVLDADDTARDVVAPGSAGLRAVVAEFGPEILQGNGTLDRSKLGLLVFKDADKRTVLNGILHPLIIAEQDRQVREWEIEDPDGIAIIDAALMIESGGYKRFDKVIVVYCRPEVQLERLMTRDNLSREEALTRISAQMPQEEKKKFADYLIDTSDRFEVARKRTEEVYEQLREEVRTEDRGPRTGDRGPETGDRRPGTGDRRPRTGDRGPGTGDRRPETEDRRPGTGDRGPET